MPNPKSGTVTFDLAKAIREVRQGRVEFKVEKAGIVHVPVGKVSFEPQKLAENASTVLETIVKAKPSTAKGVYLKAITVSSTMGPSIKIDAPGVAKMFG
jgi:large subunit ribosomal protein L1